MGFHLTKGWGKFPTKGEQHRRLSGDTAAISTLAPKEDRGEKRSATDTDATNAESIDATPGAQPVGAAGATATERDAGTAAAAASGAAASAGEAAASPASASAAASPAATDGLRARFAEFRSSSEFTSEYVAHEADGDVRCTRCSWQRIMLSNAAWKYNCEEHTKSCRKKNLVRTADGERHAAPKQRRMVDFGVGEQHQQKLR
jgi:hypothetical protein